MHDLDHCRALIVDDSPEDRVWVKRLLASGGLRGWQLVESSTVHEAVRLLTEDCFDLVIADWDLPDGEGVELLAHTERGLCRVPVILITGYEGARNSARSVGLGAADFLPKRDLDAGNLPRACLHALMRARLEHQVEAARAAERAASEGERAARLAAETALAEEQRLRRQLTALQRLSALLGRLHAVSEITAAAVSSREVFAGAEAISIYLCVGEALELQDAWGFSADTLSTWSLVPLSLSTPLTDAVTRGVPVRVETLSDLCKQLPWVAAPQASWVALPLMQRGAAIGVIGMRYAPGELPGRQHDEYLQLAVAQISDALERTRLLDQARAAADFEERLLAVLGHDLRTPLSAIGMAIELIRDRVEPRVLMRMERSARRMSEIINDILDRAAARQGLQAGKSRATNDLESVLRDQMDELRVALRRDDLVFELVGTRRAECDPSRTCQVVANLVRNAVQHGRPETPVTVRCEISDAAATISVFNEGEPIPEAERSSLFDPFYRSSPTGGTGLGLFVVQEIVTALGGSIDVQSDLGGTQFRVTLPHAVPGDSRHDVHEGRRSEF